jgi:hypothetical protein
MGRKEKSACGQLGYEAVAEKMAAEATLVAETQSVA